MIVLKDIGRFGELPEIAMHIYKGDIPALHAAIAAGWDIEDGIVLSKYTTLSPLDLAFVSERMDVVKLLVEYGVNLNANLNPAFLRAVRYCKEDIVRYIAAQGAKMDKLNQVGSGAYSQAYYGNKKNIPLIHELGLDIKLHGGAVLRQAVSNHDYKTLTYLLDHGVDINYNKPDMVYPYQATPLTVAASMGNLAMVKFLVEHGADVTLAEKDGERPYTIAVSSKNTVLADYLRSLEPADFHNVENKKYELKKYKLTDELVGFLTGDKLRLELAQNEFDIGYIDFFTLTDTIEMKVGRQKLLRLSANIDNYSDLQLVWNPKKKGLIGCYDVEHQAYADLCSFSEFLAEPEMYLMKFLEGEL
ncbi:ankyrin repeat domain-containing protein [Paenibacillus motobuensis]|uniref:ankyrin repeat domain-containing protein n=1 Tax=Paenibacillus TaxID=44249 RepID=UPI00203DE085|nr:MULTISPECIES: ankyrin repeat domain-containing protein [Paenibacillus]MCM3041245.1 ankyrin repeat domain-containing protein [Paenibacillus lutimineralis]MCM3648349.1 ankyrin repeat domain-containing protein [Paenibacillus motobuensis]